MGGFAGSFAEFTIAYLGQKVCWNLEGGFFKERDKSGKNIGVNGKNCNFFYKMPHLFGLMTKILLKRSSKLLPGKIQISLENWKFLE